MKPLTAQQVASIIDASLVDGDRDALICGGVCTDTRQLREGSLFVALSGENFDGNAFAHQALQLGATAVVVSSWDGGKPPKGAVILVENPLGALQKLASWWRAQLSLRVIGLTGSNGKTSTKDMTAAVLSQKFSTLATKGNLNNHIGLPLTVLSTCEDHQAAVYEMGMNHPGEIAPLAAIAKPQITIITNIGWDHMNLLGDSLEKIAFEKAGIIKQAVPVVVGETVPETKPVFEEKANSLHAPLHFAYDEFTVTNAQTIDHLLIVDVEETKSKAIFQYTLDLPGIYQTKNILTVLSSIRELQQHCASSTT